MPQLEFYFDFRSPYSYLALSQLPALGADIRYQPFDVLDVMGKVGNVPTSFTCKAKSRYLQHDLRRWAMRYQLPISPNPGMSKMDVSAMLHAALAAIDAGTGEAAIRLLFKAVWASQDAIANAGDIAAILSSGGLDPASLGPLGGSEAEARLAAINSAAAERGVFGAPTIFIGEQQFFGNDRFEFIAEALEQQS